MPKDHIAPDTKCYMGGTIKSLENGRVGGYLVSFTSADQKDLTGEYFTADTEFLIENYPIKGVNALFHHGLDEDVSVIPIGAIDYVEVRPDGIWAETKNDFMNCYKAYLSGLQEPDEWKAKQLAYAKEYQQFIDEMIESGELGWSSGALPQSVIVDDDGRIKRWAIIEGSLTPSAAMPFKTRVSTLKSLPKFSLKGLSAREATEDSASDRTNSHIKLSELSGETLMDEAMLRKLIQEELAAYFAASKEIEDVEIPDEAMASVEEELVEELTEDKSKMSELTEEEIEGKVAKAAGAIIAKAVQTAVEKRARRDARVKAAVSEGQKAAGANGRAPVDGFNSTKGAVNNGAAPRISVGESMKYAHLSANDMLLGHEILASQYPDAQRGRMKSSDFLSEDYLRTMVGKTLESTEKQPSKNPMDNLFIKSVMKANEIDSTTNTGFGPEWVGQVWSTRIWEKARVLRVYEQMIAKGMMEVEVPQGASTANISTESTDPTVYSYPQINDLDATGLPTVELKITPFGTGTVALTPGTLGMASAYSVLLEEDSVIPILPQLSYQQEQKAQETIEQVIVNGDTATGANTNINLIDGTPGTTTSRPYYLASNGILKYPLVTNTALSRSAAGSLSLEDYRATLALFAPQFQTRLDNLFWMVDPYVSVATLALPELATDDVRRTNATITSGLIKDLYGITYFNEGFMLKANNAGKIPAAGGTLGRFALVYAPYWAFGYKRQIKVETGYDVLAQTKILVTTLRFGIVARGADAAAVTYNVGLS